MFPEEVSCNIKHSFTPGLAKFHNISTPASNMIKQFQNCLTYFHNTFQTCLPQCQQRFKHIVQRIAKQTCKPLQTISLTTSNMSHSVSNTVPELSRKPFRRKTFLNVTILYQHISLQLQHTINNR